MLSINEEVLMFIHDFENSSREYLVSKGVNEHDIAAAHLELQWEFLHTILKQHPLQSGNSPFKSKIKNKKYIMCKSSQVTIA